MKTLVTLKTGEHQERLTKALQKTIFRKISKGVPDEKLALWISKASRLLLELIRSPDLEGLDSSDLDILSHVVYDISLSEILKDIMTLSIDSMDVNVDPVEADRSIKNVYILTNM